MGQVLAHEGGYEQFRYGTHTETTWTGNSFQKAIICSPWSGVIAVDVHNETEYKTTRTGQLIGREHAISTRGRRLPHPDRRQGRAAGPVAVRAEADRGGRHQELRVHPGAG